MKSFIGFSSLFLFHTISIFCSEYRYPQNSSDQNRKTTPLHQAAADFNRLDEIPEILRTTGNVNECDSLGNTALHLLVEHNPWIKCTTRSCDPHPEWIERLNQDNLAYLQRNVQALLLKKASVAVKNRNGQTPLNIAENSGLVQDFGCHNIVQSLKQFKPKR